MRKFETIDKEGHRGSINTDDEAIDEGQEGKIYLSVDEKSVVKIFQDNVQKTVTLLDEIIRAQPDPSTSPLEAQCLAWPLARVVEGTKSIGIVMPNAYASGWKKKVSWYTTQKVWKQVELEQKGTLKGRIEAAYQMAVAVRYLNNIGYAHADLSTNNFLVNPVTGTACLIDLDGLVVPGYMEGIIIGTPGFMAPELVMGTQKRPDKWSDRHAFAVVLYQFLLMGHPLRGRRPSFSDSLEEDDNLVMGREALYREHPTNFANRPEKPYFQAAWLGEDFAKLFQRSFVEGLFDAKARPRPSEYEMALKSLVNDLCRCQNPECLWKFFPMQDGEVEKCPICGSAAPEVKRGYMRILPRPKPGFYSLPDVREVTVKGKGMIRYKDLFPKNVGAPADDECLRCEAQKDGQWKVHVLKPYLKIAVVYPQMGYEKIEWISSGQNLSIRPNARLILDSSHGYRLIQLSKDKNWS